MTEKTITCEKTIAQDNTRTTTHKFNLGKIFEEDFKQQCSNISQEKRDRVFATMMARLKK